MSPIRHKIWWILDEFTPLHSCRMQEAGSIPTCDLRRLTSVSHVVIEISKERRMGFEPTTSSLARKHSSQLNYRRNESNKETKLQGNKEKSNIIGIIKNIL